MNETNFILMMVATVIFSLNIKGGQRPRELALPRWEPPNHPSNNRGNQDGIGKGILPDTTKIGESGLYSQENGSTKRKTA